jgi:hypothetical protein
MGDGETNKMGEAVNKEDEQGAVGPARQFGRASAPQPAAAALGLGERAYTGLQWTREVGRGQRAERGDAHAGWATRWGAGRPARQPPRGWVEGGEERPHDMGLGEEKGFFCFYLVSVYLLCLSQSRMGIAN